MDPTTLEYAPELGIPFDRMSTLSEGLYCLDHPARQGRGSGVWRDDKRPLHPGYHPDGSVFDSSRERAPFPVFVGAGQVISGWNLGIVGMQVEQPTGGKTPEGEPEVRRREIISDLGPTESSTLAVRTEGVEVGTLTATKK